MLDLINPRQTVLISCSSVVSSFGKELEKDEIYVTDWHMPVGYSKYLIAVKKGELAEDMIKKSGCFAVNFVGSEFLDKVLVCARKHGDKFKLSGFSKEDCTTIECPRIKEVVGYLECSVYDTKEEDEYVLFFVNVGEAVKISDGKRIFHVRGDKFVSCSD